MKARIALSLLAVLLTVTLAAAQNQPATAKPGPEKPGVEKKDPLFFVKIAADVAGNVQQTPLNGFLGLYIDPQNWASGLKDGDLGPFLKAQEAKPGRSAACLFSNAKDVAVCVYFDGDTPFGVAAVKAGANGTIAASDVSAAYKAISKEMLKKGEQEVRFEQGDISMDDGQPLPAFQIATGAKFPTT
jgi:hypothetical protein